MSRKNGLVGAVTLGIVLFVGLILLIMSVEKIPTGYEGVVYSASGGVTGEKLTQGWHIISPVKKVKEFTISNEQLLLTKSKKDDNSFKVSTSDDANISISFQMSYRFNSETLTDTYKKFRGMDGEDIVNNRVKAVLKSKVSEVTTNYSMMDIYSGNRSEINSKLTEHLNDSFNKTYGIEVLDASITDVHPDEKLKVAIDNRVTALQEKQQALAEQEKIKVETETKQIEAEAKAKVKITEAEAEAKANKILSESITDELIRMKEAEARQKHGWVTVNGADTVVTK